MKTCKKKEITRQMCVKKCVTLGRILQTEQWLNAMAKRGFVLQKIEGTKFHFISKEEAVTFFMLSPERGSNSSSWVYYEFLNTGGIRIPHFGTSHLSPNLVLKIPNEKYHKNNELYDYFYEHRNYRLIHRLVSNALLSVMLFLLCVAVLFIESSFFSSLFYISIGSLLVGIHNSIELFRLIKACKLQGMPVTWKRPKRPGY